MVADRSLDGGSLRGPLAVGAEGEPAQNVTYRAQVHAKGTAEEIHALMEYTDTVAEIQNTLRVGIPVMLTDIEVVNT